MRHVKHLGRLSWRAIAAIADLPVAVAWRLRPRAVVIGYRDRRTGRIHYCHPTTAVRRATHQARRHSA